jgi:hypothetical protein
MQGGGIMGEGDNEGFYWFFEKNHFEMLKQQKNGLPPLAISRGTADSPVLDIQSGLVHGHLVKT